MIRSGNLRRSGSSLVLLVVTILLTSPAVRGLAVGVGGVELRLDLPRVDGRLEVVVEDRRVPLGIHLDNLRAVDTDVRLYATEVSVSDTGAVTLGAPGSAPWLDLGDPVVRVPANSRVPVDAVVDPEALPADDEVDRLAAVVLESVDTDPTLVTRAASVVRVVGTTPPPSHAPTVISAALLVVGTALLVGRSLAGERRRPSQV